MPEMRAASPLPVKILSLLLLAFGSLALWVPRLPRDLRLKRKAGVFKTGSQLFLQIVVGLAIV